MMNILRHTSVIYNFLTIFNSKVQSINAITSFLVFLEYISIFKSMMKKNNSNNNNIK